MKIKLEQIVCQINKMKKETNFLGCTNYYLYYSGKDEEYMLTSNFSKASNNTPYLSLRDEPEKISNLISLLQYYKQITDKNKVNLSEQQKFDYFHPGLEALAKLAKEINETAKFNKNSKKSPKNP